MEALAAAVGIVDVAARASSHIWRLCEIWKDAPRGIYQLRDEVDRSNRLFTAMQESIRETANNPKDIVNQMTLEELESLLHQGHGIISSIGSIIQDLYKPCRGAIDTPMTGENMMLGDELAKRRRFLWLRKIDRVRTLRMDLQRTTSQIGLCLSVLNLSLVNESGLKIITHTSETAAGMTDRIQASLERNHHSIMNRLARVDEMEDRVVSQLEFRLSTALGTALATVPPYTPTSPTGWDAVPKSPLYGPVSPVQRSPGFPFRQQILVNKKGALSTRDEPMTTQYLTTHLSNAAFEPDQFSICPARCPCACHYTTSYGNWNHIGWAKLLGSIQISVSGKFQFSRRTAPSCRQRHSTGKIAVCYMLPSWLAQSLISLLFNYQEGPELLIRVGKIIPNASNQGQSQSIFHQVTFGDLQSVVSYVTRRPYSVLDIQADNGRSALYGAVLNSDIPKARFLVVQAGADPFHQDFAGDSPVLEAFRHFIQGEREFAEFMPFSQLLDEDDSTELHRILTGLTPLDLEATLSNPRFRTQINTANILGLAPLHIAVMRHDAKSAQILLDYGADVNVADSKRNTPLHLACFAGDIEIARLLLRSGALANVKNVRGRSPLVFTVATSRPTTTDLMDLLLQYGSDIEALDIYKGTPLALATHMNSVLAVEHLIRIGANVNARDWEGDIPLTEAMRGPHCRVVDILLRAGADIRNIDVYGRGVLHRLAEGGNIEMVTLLGKSGRFTEECNHPDNSGRMPMDLLDKREDVGPELRAAFRELLTSLGTGGTREPDQSRDGFVEPESDDEFHDAMEE